MLSFSFWKYHGLGNDFVIVDNLEGQHTISTQAIVQICDRNRGIGADGLILVEKSSKAFFRMVLFNADGTRPEMCGNGLRCMVQWLQEQNKLRHTSVEIETDRGILSCQILLDKSTQTSTIRVDMGAPILLPALIPMDAEGEQFIEQSFPVKGKDWLASAVSMGNPHLIFFRPFGDQEREYSPFLESHPFFPRKTNVEFVQEMSTNHFQVVVFERGCGFTQACGTGACAVAVACCKTGRADLDREIQIDLPGGSLWIEVPSDYRTVWMRGSATPVFQGKWTSQG